MTIDLHHISEYFAYWVLGWSVVNILLPPRETFRNCSPAAQQRYNTLLMLVAYYGSLNVRQLSVKLYDSVNQNGTDVEPHKLDHALLDAAVSTEKVKQEADKAQDAISTAKASVPGDK